MSMSFSNMVSHGIRRVLENTATDRRLDNFNVLEISGKSNIESVASYKVNQRSGGLILHGPIVSTGLSSIVTRPSKFNLILHMPAPSEKMYSLFRTEQEKDGFEIFTLYKESFPILVDIDPTAFADKDKLERICVKLRENRGWSAAHICSAFDYYRYFYNDKMKKYINLQEEIFLRTPLHIAIQNKNLTSITTLLELGAQIDIKDINMNSVFHFAADTNTHVLQTLDGNLRDASRSLISDLNGEGFTALHLSCRANNADTVKSLLNMGANVNVPSPKEGFPIHSAVKARSVCSIKELISQNPEQLTLRDLAEGGTPLHFCAGADTLVPLLELGCDPNIANNLGNTPLHNSARRVCLKSTLSLLCHQAFTDIKGENGDTALHAASRLCSKPILQALIVFGCDVNLLNDLGHSARHLVSTSQRDDNDKKHSLFILSSVGSKRCPESKKSECTDGCISGGSYNGECPPNFNPQSNPNMIHEALNAFSVQRQVRERIDSEEGEPMDFDRGTEVTDNVRSGTSTAKRKPQERGTNLECQLGGRLLCLDGGGIRGLILIQILGVIEQELGIPVIEAFDWVAGTSTGGILALALACGKSVAEAQAIYLRLKDKVFVGSRPYSSEVMDQFLKQEFGCERTMSSIRRPRIMITSAVVDRRPCDLHMFRNYLSPATLLNEYDPHFQFPEEQFVWETAKVTGAAPSYFRLDHNKFIDGGLISNNPTLDALTELQQFNAAMRAVGQLKERFRVPTVVVSLGTGIQPKVDSSTGLLDITWPNGIFDAITKVPRLANLVNLLIDQATQTEGQVVERSRAWCSSIGVPFFRFSPKMTSFVDLDEKDDEVLVNLMWETIAYMFTNKASLVELKHHLFKNGSPPPDDN